MRKQIRRKGRLLQKPKIEKLFKVIAIKWIDGEYESVWTEGEYESFEEAKNRVDKLDTSTISYYVHNNSNRVLYEKGENRNA